MAKNDMQPDMLQELKRSIRERNPGRLYFFHGEEVFLLQYYLNQLKKLLTDELTESFNYHKFTEENFDLRSFADAVESLPMMAEYTFVWVDDVDIFKLSEDERTKLCDVMADIPEYCTVVFTFETVAWKPDKRQKKFWDIISNQGMVVEFAKQSQSALISWITRHFGANGKQITPDLCVYLIDLTGGTMTALAGEISKICAYSDADHIVKQDIDAVVEPVMDAVVFQMTDMLGQGAYGAALAKLQQLLKMQEPPIKILAAIGAQFRRMSTARILMDHGKAASDLTRLCGIKEYAAQKTMSSAKRFSLSFYEKTASLVLETDRAMKTSFDDQERLLELLILDIAQEARNG